MGTAAPWTEEEDALLRAAVGASRRRGSIPWDKVAQATGRTALAARIRAYCLRLALPNRPWTAEEDAYLLREWADCRMRTLQEHLPNRSARAIVHRAASLGLCCADRRQGLVSITVASERAGYSPEGILSLLARQGVTPHRASARVKKGTQRPRLYVAWDDVVAAVARDTALETPKAAARRLGVSSTTVYARLRAAGVPASGGRRLFLDPKTIDRAMGVAA